MGIPGFEFGALFQTCLEINNFKTMTKKTVQALNKNKIFVGKHGIFSPLESNVKTFAPQRNK
jgi:hypothetical protein